MNTLEIESELTQLPDQIYQARCAALDVEQRLLAANRHYEQLRSQHYLHACSAGDGHFKALNVAAMAPEVLTARNSRDQVEAEYKRAAATHALYRDRLKALLHSRNVDHQFGNSH